MTLLPFIALQSLCTYRPRMRGMLYCLNISSGLIVLLSPSHFFDLISFPAPDWPGHKHSVKLDPLQIWLCAFPSAAWSPNRMVTERTAHPAMQNRSAGTQHISRVRRGSNPSLNRGQNSSQGNISQLDIPLPSFMTFRMPLAETHQLSGLIQGNISFLLSFHL